MDSVRVFAPATVANVGCAFDVLGFALHQPGDEVRVTKNQLGAVRITEITGDGGLLSCHPTENTATVSILSLLKAQNSRQGFDVEIHKKLPLGSGLGSSAASAVAGVFAANLLLDQRFSPEELLPFALDGEAVASGAIHADNVGPSLLGGFILTSSYSPLQIHRIPFPQELLAVVVHPHMVLNTREARRVLPSQLDLKVAVGQWGRVGGLISGLHSGDFQTIAASLKDEVAEPARAHLIPGFALVKDAALNQGSLGCSISGAGPSVFALCTPAVDPEKIGEAMKSAFWKAGLPATAYISKINPHGPTLLD